MRKIVSYILRVLLSLAAAAVVAAAAVLWQLDRELPAAARRWLEGRLSQGPVGVMFSHASFNPWRGLVLRDVRVHAKQTLNGPLINAEGLRLHIRVRPNQPPATWLEGVTFHGLTIEPFHWPSASDGGMLRRYWAAWLDPSSPHGPMFAKPVPFAIESGSIYGVELERAVFSLRSQKGRLFAENIRLDIEARDYRERLDGWATFDLMTGKLQASAAGTLTPDVVERLCLFLDGKTAVDMFHDFSNYDAPLNVSGSMTVETPDTPEARMTCDARLVLQGAGGRYRGQPYSRIQLALQWFKNSLERKLTVAPVVLTTENGTAELAVAYRPVDHVSDFTFRSNLPFPKLFYFIERNPPVETTNLLFRTAPVLTLSGTIPGSLAVGREILVQGRAQCDSLAYRNVNFGDVRADFIVRGTNNVEISSFNVRCHGGTITGNLVAKPSASGKDPPQIEMAAEIEKVDLDAVVRDAGSDVELGGELSAWVALAFPWRTGRLDRVMGQGWFEVRKGAFMRIPLFAGLTDFLGRNVPGVDAVLMQSDAHLPFMVTNGVVSIDNFRVEGNVFSLNSRGVSRIDLPGYPCQGVAQLRFFKQKTLAGMLARVVTLPISKMMEFRISGSTLEPDWSYIGLFDRVMDTFRGSPENDLRDGTVPEENAEGTQEGGEEP